MDGPPTAAPDEPLRPQADARMHTVQVRWTRPTFVTYFTLAVYWGVSTGVAFGLLGMAASLLGVFAGGGRVRRPGWPVSSGGRSSWQCSAP